MHSFLRLGLKKNLLFCMGGLWLIGDLLLWPRGQGVICPVGQPGDRG